MVMVVMTMPKKTMAKMAMAKPVMAVAHRARHARRDLPAKAWPGMAKEAVANARAAMAAVMIVLIFVMDVSLGWGRARIALR